MEELELLAHLFNVCGTEDRPPSLASTPRLNVRAFSSFIFLAALCVGQHVVCASGSQNSSARKLNTHSRASRNDEPFYFLQL